jgi:nitrate reductase gamma subunit
MLEETIYELLRSPLVSVSAAGCLLGILFQFIRFWLTSRKIPEFCCQPDTRPTPRMAGASIARPHSVGFAKLRQTALGRAPVMTSVTMLFHAGLVLAPVFLVGHNVLLDQSWGFSLPCFPERISDHLTMIVLGACLFFLVRRVFIARVRAPSSFYDFFILSLVSMPFLTGCIAFRQLFDYRTLIMLHMAAGELLIVALPFTKLMHAVYFFINRVLVGGEHSFNKKGRKVWLPCQ